MAPSMVFAARFQRGLGCFCPVSFVAKEKFSSKAAWPSHGRAPLTVWKRR